jgi:hypothetical protein
MASNCEDHLILLLLSPSGLFIFRNTQTDKATSSAVPVFLRRSPIRRYRFVLESLSCREISFMELPWARFCSTMDSSALNCGSGACIAPSKFLQGAEPPLAKLRANCFNVRSGPSTMPSSDFLNSRVLMTEPCVPPIAIVSRMLVRRSRPSEQLKIHSR